jgi:hypothetical protein
MAQQPADRHRDVAWRERGCRDLVQQGLKDVMIRPVDQGDIDRRMAELLRGGDSGESATDDEDVGTP